MPDKFNISVIELLDRPLPLMLDKDMADLVGAYLKAKGLNILTEEKVEKLIGLDGKISGAVLASGKILDADMVFISIGVRPNIKLAEDIGLEIGGFGIKVNKYQETSNPDILAGGDCVRKSILSRKSRLEGSFEARQ